MDKEYEMEELADMAIEELRCFIDTESQSVEEEHDLHSKLLSWDYVILHLDERIPENMVHLRGLNDKISDKLTEIRDMIKSEELHELEIIKEEKQILTKLEKDVGHREWKAVRTDIDQETKEEKEVLRLKEEELKKLHSKFIDLMKIMKKSKLIKAIEEDLAVGKEKDQYKKLEEYYYVQIYKFIRAYEKIFRHLWDKELILARKIDGVSKGIG